MPTDAVVHNIIDPSEWPSSVQRIAQGLVPAYLITTEYSSVYSGASDLLQELSGSCLRVATDDRVWDEALLTDVFDIVLSTVGGMRELVMCKDYGPRPTVPLWSTLIKALGHACSDDISIMGEIPFILPRIVSIEGRKREALEGTATVLLTYIVDSVGCSESQSTTGTSNVECKSTNSQLSDKSMANAERKDDISMDYPSSKGSSTVSIDVPFEAHVLPGHGRRFCAVLPLLCVADEDNITSLLSSVLYQRRVWGINEPVVGFVFSKTGTIGQVLFGWLELDSINDYGLPTVNIARAITDSASEPSLGVFNLTDLRSTFALAQFILGLSTHFRTIISGTSDPQMHTLDWRSDHIAIDDQNTNGEQWKIRVAQWARDVHRDDSSEDSSLPHTPSPHEPFSTGMPNKKPHAPEASSTSQNESNKDAVSGTPTSGSVVPSINLPTPSPRGSRSESQFSSSAFGTRSAGGLLADEISISTWLFERRALTIALIELEGDMPNIKEINCHIKLYHNMTRLLWPASWTTVEKLPKVDRGVEQAREHLFTQYNEIRDKVGGQGDGRGNSNDSLESGHVEIFKQRLSALLWATMGAYTLKEAQRARLVYEAEARHDWDAVLYRFFVPPGQCVSSDVLLERTLRFPRNDAADGTDSAEVIASQLELAGDYAIHCVAAQATAVRRNAQLVRDQALAASIQANAFSDDLRTFQPAHFLATVKQRAAREPNLGICDALLVTPVSLGIGQSDREPNAEKYLEQFNLIKLTAPVKANTQNPVPPSSSHLSPTASLTSSPKVLSSSRKELSSEQKTFLRNPLCVSCTESKFASAIEIRDGARLFESNDLLLSGFVAEYKKLGDGEAKALNQERMYLVSLVKFLAALGIKGFDVYGLITSGQSGGIMMAWQSEVEDKIYIIERNIRTFNLSSPIEAFQFASFLIRLRVHTDTLKALFENKKAGFLKKVEERELPTWRKDAQVVVTA